MSEPYISIENLDFILNRLQALSHPDRIAILELLQSKGKVSVAEIQAHLNIEQAPTSYHLRILRDQHLVIVKRAGQRKYYSINYTILAEIITSISKCS